MNVRRGTPGDEPDVVCRREKALKGENPTSGSDLKTWSQG
jgi:hypothetical protein